MASNIDFSTGIVYSPVVDRIHRGDRIRDDLPRRRNQTPEKPDGKDSGETSPEDIKTSDEDGTEKHRLDLRA
ncbi:MAG: hypothetical protein LBJ21_08325 [Acidobacteriota bacterium]|nr:hypothetical protein [Acidobacteriota bacterium]